MSTTIVVGCQWGDEGKGKIIDYLAQDYDVVIRFQGGDNAGHTVVNEHGVFKFHLIPCGIFNKNAVSIIGTGTVVNLDVVKKELEIIAAAGFDPGQLKISNRAHVLMPFHVDFDTYMEQSNTSEQIGTTKRGIGPAYAGKAYRHNIRVGDLKNLDEVKKVVSGSLPFINHLLKYYNKEAYTLESIMEKCEEWAAVFDKHIIDQHQVVQDALAVGRNILFEGQLGTMRDIDHGFYPYVTSSHPTAAYASASAGIPLKKVDRIIGVCKAFCSQVGSGIFPTVATGECEEIIRGQGNKVDDEFGATTGRPRKVGWLSIPEVKYSHQINGFDELVLTKVDRLDELKEIKLCVDFELDGEVAKYLPGKQGFTRVKPKYEIFEGWMTSTREVKKRDQLPPKAQKYISRIEELLNIPVTYIGNGPHRQHIVVT